VTATAAYPVQLSTFVFICCGVDPVSADKKLAVSKLTEGLLIRV
jgi:hypothetical protein